MSEASRLCCSKCGFDDEPAFEVWFMPPGAAAEQASVVCRHCCHMWYVPDDRLYDLIHVHNLPVYYDSRCVPDGSAIPTSRRF